MTRRTQQMGEFLREEVVDIIRSEIDDPRLGFWTITRVEVLPDLRSARIYVSSSALMASARRRSPRCAARPGSSAAISSRACAPGSFPISIPGITARWSTPKKSTAP